MTVKKKSLEHSLDFVGIFAALICAVHCAALPLLLTIGALGSMTWLKNPQLEWGFIIFSVVIAASSLLWSFLQKHQNHQAIWMAVLGISLIIGSHFGHGTSDHWLTAFGGILLAAAHALNWLLLQNKFRFYVSNQQLLFLTCLVVVLFTYKFTQIETHPPKSQEEFLELVWEKK